MTDTKITIVCKEGEDHITDISLTAERNYTPIFTEAFSTQEKPLSVYLIKSRYKSRFICQWYKKKSRPPLSLWHWRSQCVSLRFMYNELFVSKCNSLCG